MLMRDFIEQRACELQMLRHTDVPICISGAFQHSSRPLAVSRAIAPQEHGRVKPLHLRLFKTMRELTSLFERMTKVLLRKIPVSVRACRDARDCLEKPATERHAHRS